MFEEPISFYSYKFMTELIPSNPQLGGGWVKLALALQASTDLHYKQLILAANFCLNNFKREDWAIDKYSCYFKNEEDANFFQLIFDSKRE